MAKNYSFTLNGKTQDITSYDSHTNREFAYQVSLSPEKNQRNLSTLMYDKLSSLIFTEEELDNLGCLEEEKFAQFFNPILNAKDYIN
jgi:hypothetical protein